MELSKKRANYDLNTNFRRLLSRGLWVIKKTKEKYAYKNHILDEIQNIQSTSIIYETSKLENVPKYIGGVTKENKRKQHQSLT